MGDIGYKSGLYEGRCEGSSPEWYIRILRRTRGWSASRSPPVPSGGGKCPGSSRWSSPRRLPPSRPSCRGAWTSPPRSDCRSSSAPDREVDKAGQEILSPDRSLSWPHCPPQSCKSSGWRGDHWAPWNTWRQSCGEEVRGETLPAAPHQVGGHAGVVPKVPFGAPGIHKRLVSCCKRWSRRMVFIKIYHVCCEALPQVLHWASN